jgi:hypothetical protein
MPTPSTKAALAAVIRKRVEELKPFVIEARKMGLSVSIVTAECIHLESPEVDPIHLSITEKINY